MSALPRDTIRRSAGAAILGVWWCVPSVAAAAAEVDFYRDVYPVIKSNCVACHNKTTTKAALNLETPETMRQGGDSGEGVIPGNSAESLIYQAAAHVGEVVMPPKGNKSHALDLTPGELALLKTWIDQGAKSSVKQARQVAWRSPPPTVAPIYTVATTRNGRLAACGRANQAFIYDLNQRRLVARLVDQSLNNSEPPPGAAHAAFVQSLAFSPDGARLASGSFQEVKIWRRKHAPAAPLRLNGAIEKALKTIIAGRPAVGSQLRDVAPDRWVLERTLGGRSAASPFVDRVNAVCFSPDGETLAAGGGEPTRSGDVSLWNIASGSLVGDWKDRHSDAVLSLAFSPDGKWLASGGADRFTRIADAATGKIHDVFEGHTHHVLGASFRGDGRVLATAGGDGVVIVWDAISGERKTKIEGWSKEVASVQFIGTSNHMLTSSGDGQVKVVDDAGKPLRTMDEPPEFLHSVACPAAGGVIVGGGEAGLLHVWNAADGREIVAFRPDPNATPP